MAKTKPNSKRKTRSDNFPLTLHPTGQYCKKIKGKIYYFGKDKHLAHERYLEYASSLRTDTPKITHGSLSIKELCNIYLEHQESRVEIGEIQSRHYFDQISLLKDFVKFIGKNRIVSDISTMELQNYRRKLIKAGKSPNTINNRISAIKSMYNWAINNEIIEDLPRLKAVKKITPKKYDKPTFTTSQIQKLLENASLQMKAMIWLGLNCGLGCTDCSELKWTNLDLENGRINFPRGKTGISRNLPLWSETIKAINDIPKSGELVFYTRKGNPWVRSEKGIGKNHKETYKKIDNVGKAFSSLIKKTGIKVDKGVGFYTLRRTAATLIARSGDPFAVQRLLGHADLKMATTYVQDVSEQTDRAINNSRKFIIQDDS